MHTTKTSYANDERSNLDQIGDADDDAEVFGVREAAKFVSISWRPLPSACEFGRRQRESRRSLS